MIKVFCCLLVLGFAGLFVLKSPNGTPWLSISDFMPDTRSLESSINDLVPNVSSDDERDSVPVYKWRDAQGNWQFSDQPPKGVEAELVTVDTTINRNLLPAPSRNVETSSTTTNSGGATLISNKSLSPTTVAPTDIPTLIDDARNVQELIDGRQDRLDSVIKKSE